jgi:hypothetical protein
MSERPVDADVESCLRRFAEAFAGATPAHRALFAALVASRHERDLGEDADAVREMIARLWTAANGDALTTQSAESFAAKLQGVAELVDPDRVNASDVYRALGLLEVALRCAAGVPEISPVDLARAALAASAGLPPRDEAEVRQKLPARWSWEGVQAEARWLGVVADTLGKLSVVDEAAVEAVARTLGAVESAPGSR